MTSFAKLTAAVSVPWNAFVAAFLYYTLLAMLAVGGTSPGAATVASAYAMPPLMYGVTLLLRAVRAAAAWVRAPRSTGLHSAAHSAA